MELTLYAQVERADARTREIGIRATATHGPAGWSVRFDDGRALANDPAPLTPLLDRLAA